MQTFNIPFRQKHSGQGTDGGEGFRSPGTKRAEIVIFLAMVVILGTAITQTFGGPSKILRVSAGLWEATAEMIS